jgi:hypothetical protein
MGQISRAFGLLALFFLAGVLLVLPGCGADQQGAREAYERIVFHARTGNEAAFLKGFTPRSQQLIKSLIALRRTYGDLVDAESDPYRALVLDTVESVEVETQVVKSDQVTEEERKVAILTVTNGDYLRKIRMVELDDGWKIDALALQDYWAEDDSRRLER